MGSERPAVEYPPDWSDANAWNAIAARNNRIQILLQEHAE